MLLEISNSKEKSIEKNNSFDIQSSFDWVYVYQSESDRKSKDQHILFHSNERIGFGDPLGAYLNDPFSTPESVMVLATSTKYWFNFQRMW